MSLPQRNMNIEYAYSRGLSRWKNRKRVAKPWWHITISPGRGGKKGYGWPYKGPRGRNSGTKTTPAYIVDEH